MFRVLQATRTRRWCDLGELPLKNNIQLVYMHRRLTVKGVIKIGICTEGKLIKETNLFYMEEHK